MYVLAERAWNEKFSHTIPHSRPHVPDHIYPADGFECSGKEQDIKRISPTGTNHVHDSHTRSPR